MTSLSWNLCLVADVEAAAGRDLVSLVVASVEAGATLIQLRAKTLPTRSFLSLALEMGRSLEARGVPLIINDRADIALAASAGGVHLGQDDLPIAAARRLLGPRRLIGMSVSNAEEAMCAEREGADYLGVGPVFPTSTKATTLAPLGLEGLRDIRKRVRCPILAIGGINARNAEDAAQAGADGVAVVSAILSAPAAGPAAAALAEAFLRGKGRGARPPG